MAKQKKLRRRMDWTGNIIEEEEKSTKEERDHTDKPTDPFEQHMANIELGEGDAGDSNETACHFDSDDLYKCPNFYPAEPDEEGDPKGEVIECRVCGRYMWKRK